MQSWAHAYGTKLSEAIRVLTQIVALYALDRARSGVRPAVDVNPIVVERFGVTMREKLTTGEVPFRKAYLGRNC